MNDVFQCPYCVYNHKRAFNLQRHAKSCPEFGKSDIDYIKLSDYINIRVYIVVPPTPYPELAATDTAATHESPTEPPIISAAPIHQSTMEPDVSFAITSQELIVEPAIATTITEFNQFTNVPSIQHDQSTNETAISYGNTLIEGDENAHEWNSELVFSAEGK